jgi:hypothetical protein
MIFYISTSIINANPFGYFKNKKFIKNRISGEKYIKVGVSNNIDSRIAAYQTIVPGIGFYRTLEFSKSVCFQLEKAYKKFLSEYNYLGTECYRINPYQGLYFLVRCISSIGYSLIDYVVEEKRGVDSKYLYYLDNIYFGKKIPLFSITLNKFKDKKKNSRGFLTYEKIKNFSEDDIDKFFKLNEKSNLEYGSKEMDYPYDYKNKNVLFNFMEDIDKFLSYIVRDLNEEYSGSDDSIYTLGQVKFGRFNDQISELIFEAISKYYNHFKSNEKIKKRFLKDYDFFNKRIKSGMKFQTKKFILDTLRHRAFDCFAHLYDKSTKGLGTKEDPYQLKNNKYSYFKKLDISKRNIKSLISEN